jgi:CubicO group peptidase (beta-lactamase class C family)
VSKKIRKIFRGVTMKKILYVLMIGLAVWSVAASARTPDKTPVPQTAAELRAELEKTMREGHVPGMSIVVISGGKVELQAGLGLASVAHKRPATDATLFRIGSISKGLVALAVLKLQEEGKLKLTDTLRQWAPEITFENRWENTDPVRLVQLLEHTSGFNDMSLREYAHNEPQPIALKAALEANPGPRKTRWRPGSRWAYNNVGPALAAYVVEKASGQRFEDYVKQHFFKPLQMDTATYFLPDESNFANQYGPDGITQLPYWHMMYRPAGSINASARDMARYLMFFLQRGKAGDTQVLQAESLQRMERAETLPMSALGVKAAYGLYTFNMMEKGFRFRGHAGAVNGSLADMMYLPEHGAGYAFMMNSGNPAVYAKVSALLKRYLVRQLTPGTHEGGINLSADVIGRYSGYYRNVSPRNDGTRFAETLFNIQKIVLNETGMATQNPFGGLADQWTALSGNVFRKVKDPEPSLALLPDEDGEIIIQSTWGTWKKVSAGSALAPALTLLAGVLLMLSSIGFAFVWGIRKLAGKLPVPGPLHVRALPLAASVFFFMMAGTFAVSSATIDPLAGFGIPTFKSVFMFLLGIGFALASFSGLWAAWRQRKTPMNRVAYWHSAMVSIACSFIAAYLLYWGAIGVPSWMM